MSGVGVGLSTAAPGGGAVQAAAAGGPAHAMAAGPGTLSRARDPRCGVRGRPCCTSCGCDAGRGRRQVLGGQGVGAAAHSSGCAGVLLRLRFGAEMLPAVCSSGPALAAAGTAACRFCEPRLRLLPGDEPVWVPRDASMPSTLGTSASSFWCEALAATAADVASFIARAWRSNSADRWCCCRTCSSSGVQGLPSQAALPAAPALAAPDAGGRTFNGLSRGSCAPPSVCTRIDQEGRGRLATVHVCTRLTVSTAINVTCTFE